VEDWQPHNTRSNISRRTPWPLAICLLLFALNNIAMLPLTEIIFSNITAAMVVGYACAAVIGTQLAFHALWCVLAPCSLGHRIVSGVFMAMVLIGAWFLGFLLWTVMSDVRFTEWDIVAAIFLSIPLLAVAVQTPLWAAKLWFGWRIVTPACRRDAAIRRPFGIRDLLIGMALGACVLSAAQLGVPPNLSTEGFLVPLVIYAVVLAVVSLLTTIPAIAAILRSRRIAWALGALLLYDVTLAIAVIETFVAFAETDTLMLRLVFGSLFGVYFLSLTGCMVAFRAAGWRLQWGRPRERIAEPPDGNPFAAKVG
jgi:hypothetical protein